MLPGILLLIAVMDGKLTSLPNSNSFLETWLEPILGFRNLYPIIWGGVLKSPDQYCIKRYLGEKNSNEVRADRMRVNDAVVFARDWHYGRQRVIKNRWYGVVREITEQYIIVEQAASISTALDMASRKWDEGYLLLVANPLYYPAISRKKSIIKRAVGGFHFFFKFKKRK